MRNPSRLLIEECAEVIQAVTKIDRFGIDNINPYTQKTNRSNAEEEIGQLMFMIDAFVYENDLDTNKISQAYSEKEKALEYWSQFEDGVRPT